MIIGIHVSKQSNISGKKINELHLSMNEKIKYFDINAAQIFTYGPKFIIKNKINYGKVKEITKHIDLVVHSAYMSIVIWKVDNKNVNSLLSKNYLDIINKQMESCAEIGAWGFVLHISKIPAKKIVETMKILEPISEKTGVKILLEMIASKAMENTYETPEKLDNLAELLDKQINTKNWGFCIDTAHIWSAGVDIQNYDNMQNWIEDIKCKNKILLIHLNGSQLERGCGKDKHEILFAKTDKIWKDYSNSPEKSGACALIKFAVKNKIPMICEVNEDKKEELFSSLSIIKKLID
jgi:endonuclease IV